MLFRLWYHVGEENSCVMPFSVLRFFPTKLLRLVELTKLTILEESTNESTLNANEK